MDAPKSAPIAADPPEVEGGAPGKTLSPAARRALEEAAGRRAASGAVSGQPDRDRGEEGGPSGPEPTRYGDWERKGLAVDF